MWNMVEEGCSSVKRKIVRRLKKVEEGQKKVEEG